MIPVASLVPVKGSLPVRLKATRWAPLVLPGYPLRTSLEIRWALSRVVGQAPEGLIPYPRPARPSGPPPS